MFKFALAASLLAFSAVLAVPAQAATTWEGTSVGVFNEDTFVFDIFTVRFTFDGSPPLFVTPLIAQNPAHTPYIRAMYGNITAFSVTGPAGTTSFGTGNAFVSTLAPALAQFGSVPFLVLAGTDGNTPGLQMQFTYTPATAYADTAMPTALGIGAPGTDNGFNLLEYYWEGDPADETIGGPRTLLNFRFASGGFLPDAGAVPEPATWATMLGGFGLAGAAMRRRRSVARAA